MKDNEKIDAIHIPVVSGQIDSSFTKEQADFLVYTNGIPEDSPYWLKWEGNMPYENWLNSEYKKWLENGKPLKKDQSEIKPANTVKVIEIDARSDEYNDCSDLCYYKQTSKIFVGTCIGSLYCQKCDHYNQDMSNTARHKVVCSKYTEEQAKAQNLKYSIV